MPTSQYPIVLHAIDHSTRLGDGKAKNWDLQETSRERDKEYQKLKICGPPTCMVVMMSSLRPCHRRSTQAQAQSVPGTNCWREPTRHPPCRCTRSSPWRCQHRHKQSTCPSTPTFELNNSLMQCYDTEPNFHFKHSSLSTRSPTPSATYPHPRDVLPRTTVKVPSPPVHFPSPHAPAEPPATSDDLIKVRPFHSSHDAPDCPTAIHLSSTDSSDLRAFHSTTQNLLEV